MLDKAATIKKFENLTLGSELKKQTGIAKDQYKFSKDQINVNNDNRKDDIKKEDGEIDDVDHSYIGDEYKDLINNFLKIKGWIFAFHRIRQSKTCPNKYC